MGIKAKVNNGRNTPFLMDVWACEVPLKLESDGLYAPCGDNRLLGK